MTTVTPELLDLLIAEHRSHALPRLRRCWDYYRNRAIVGDPTDPGRRFRWPQEQGLPERITRTAPGTLGPGATTRQRERVVENDIAWRIHSLVDFMFGKPVTIQSAAPDPTRAEAIEAFLHDVFEASGGIGFFQDMALLGSVYGFVDVVVNVAENPGIAMPGLCGCGIYLELIEAPRAIPLLAPSDYRQLDAYVVHYRQQLNQVADGSALSRFASAVTGASRRRAVVERTIVWTDQLVQSFTTSPRGKRRLDAQHVNRLGVIPVVHIQNLPQPFFYEGLSEVEPLIPLQDELNTRLSDRANRVTFQSFKMYLGKGIDQFNAHPVGPGQMWSTDNTQASIEEFGGDAESPSETAHIQEIREAMDKTSGVSPVAAGIVRDRVGNLTSENALRIVLMGLLARTDKKRQTYGVGIARLCELILHAADTFGLFATTPDERRVRLDWPSALPENQTQRLQDALLKLRLGVPQKQVLAELGYGDCAGPDPHQEHEGAKDTKQSNREEETASATREQT